MQFWLQSRLENTTQIHFIAQPLLGYALLCWRCVKFREMKMPLIILGHVTLKAKTKPSVLISL